MVLLRQTVCALILLVVATMVQSVSAQEATPSSSVTAEAFRSINIRSGPSTNFEVIDQLAEGLTVQVVGRSDPQNNWLLIDNDGTDGWVAYFTVVVEGDPSTLPIVDSTVEQQRPTLLPATEAVAEVSGQVEAVTDLFVSAYRRVNVRTGPGTEFSIIGVLAPGETADIVGSSGEDNEWLEIDFNGENGWVAYFVVNISGDLNALAIPDPDIAAAAVDNVMTDFSLADAPTQALDSNQVLLITRFNTNLRAGPQFASEVLAVVPYETTLEAEARTADNNWLRVTYEGQTGWLISSLVNTGVSDVESLPIAE